MKCLNCGRKFEYPKVRRTSQARMFGVTDIYNDNYFEEKLCPYCNSDEIEEEEDGEDI